MPKTIAFLALLLASTLTASADEQVWSKSFDIKGTPDVVLKSNDAHVTVNVWDQKKIGATVKSSGYERSEYEVIPRQSGDRVEIELKVRKSSAFTFSWSGFLNKRIGLEVSMPAKGNLDVNTADGHVGLTGVAGKIAVRTGDGHINGRDLSGSMDLRTGNGHIGLQGLRGSLNAHTGDGHINVGGRFEQLNLETGNGHVTARVQEGSAMTAGWTLRTGDGHINVFLPRDFAAELDASTEDGRVVTQLDAIANTQGGRNRSAFRGKLGKGGRTFVIHSKNGTVRIGRS